MTETLVLVQGNESEWTSFTQYTTQLSHLKEETLANAMLCLNTRDEETFTSSLFCVTLFLTDGICLRLSMHCYLYMRE